MESNLERLGSCPLHRRLALRAIALPFPDALVPPLGNVVFLFGLANGKYAGAYLCVGCYG